MILLARKYLAGVAQWLGIWTVLLIVNGVLSSLFGRGDLSLLPLLKTLPGGLVLAVPVATYLAAVAVAPLAAKLPPRTWALGLLTLALLGIGTGAAIHLGALVSDSAGGANLVELTRQYQAALASAHGSRDFTDLGFSASRASAYELGWSVHYPFASTVFSGIAALLGALLGTWLSRQGSSRLAWPGWLAALVLVGYNLFGSMIAHELTTQRYAPPILAVWGHLIAPMLVVLALWGPVSVLRTHE